MLEDYHPLSLASTIDLWYCDESTGDYVTNVEEIIEYLQNNLLTIFDKISTLLVGVTVTFRFSASQSELQIQLWENSSLLMFVTDIREFPEWNNPEIGGYLLFLFDSCLCERG